MSTQRAPRGHLTVTVGKTVTTNATLQQGFMAVIAGMLAQGSRGAAQAKKLVDGMGIFVAAVPSNAKYPKDFCVIRPGLVLNKPRVSRATFMALLDQSAKTLGKRLDTVAQIVTTAGPALAPLPAPTEQAPAKAKSPAKVAKPTAYAAVAKVA